MYYKLWLVTLAVDDADVDCGFSRPKLDFMTMHKREVVRLKE